MRFEKLEFDAAYEADLQARWALSDRLDAIAKHHGLSRHAFYNGRCGFPTGTYSGWFRSRSGSVPKHSPEAAQVWKIIERGVVRLEWLLSGALPMVHNEQTIADYMRSIAPADVKIVAQDLANLVEIATATERGVPWSKSGQSGTTAYTPVHFGAIRENSGG